MLLTMFRTLIAALPSRRALAMENLALRHQLAVLARDLHPLARGGIPTVLEMEERRGEVRSDGTTSQG